MTLDHKLISAQQRTLAWSKGEKVIFPDPSFRERIETPKLETQRLLKDYISVLDELWRIRAERGHLAASLKLEGNRNAVGHGRPKKKRG